MTEDGWCIWRGCWNDEDFTSAENDNTMAMGKTNMGSLKNRKKNPQNLTRNPLLFHIFREPESYILLFFSIYPLNPIFGTYRLLIDFTILTTPKSKTKTQSYPPEFMDWTNILDLKADPWATEFGRHWWISSACRATREEQQDLAGAGREGRHVAEKQSPWPTWVYLAPVFGNAIDRGRHSLWMLQARLPNHPHMCNVALTASASQSLLRAILQVWKWQEAKVALGSSVLDLVYGAATSKTWKKKDLELHFAPFPTGRWS